MHSITFRTHIAALAAVFSMFAVDASNADERRALPNGSYEIAQASDPRVFVLEEQLRQLNGRIEELTFQILELQEQLRRMQEDNEFRFQELENSDRTDAGEGVINSRKDAAGLPPPQPPPNNSIERGAPPRNLGSLTIDGDGNVIGVDVDFSGPKIDSAISGDAVASLDIPNDPEELYRDGYTHVLNGDYDMAEGMFRSFVELYPDDPLTADARFWLAESVRGQGRLEEAAEIFIATRTAYPNSLKAPETLLKIGQIMAQLGDRDVACVTFDDAESSYPNMSDNVRTLIREERAKAQC